MVGRMVNVQGSLPYFHTFKNILPGYNFYFFAEIWYIAPILCLPQNLIFTMCKYDMHVKICNQQLSNIT